MLNDVSDVLLWWAERECGYSNRSQYDGLYKSK